jgi:PAS domain S-box-containing protein
MSSTSSIPNNRILVVDDNPAIHSDFRKILARKETRDTDFDAAEAALFGEVAETGVTTGFEIDSAHQGQEGLAKVEQAVREGRPYALAFVDIRMPPGWDGVETISHIWKCYPEVQVVICTAYADYSWEDIVKRVGATDNLVILKKPFDNVEVLQLAHALTKKWLLNQQARVKMEDLDRMVAQRTRELEEANTRLQTEVAERTRAEQALRLSEERFEKAFKASPIPMVILTLADQRYLDANDSFLAMTGHAREEVLERTPEQLQICEPEQRRAIFTQLEAQGVVRHFECPIRTKGGETRQTLVSVERLKVEVTPCALVLMQDITDRLKLENQLRQSQKMEAVGQLASGVAHDFNNILTIIQGHISLRLAARNLGREVEDSLKLVAQAAERAAALTRQLLAFSRKQVMQRRALNLNDVLQQSTNMLHRLIGEHIKLTCDFQADLPLMSADPCNLEQVVMNLAVNARDAMPKGGTLTLATSAVQLTEDLARHNPESRPGRFICLRVTDTGCGIEPGILGRIFEPFFTTKDVGKGSGLGLSTVHGIVKQHEGWIELTSEVGVGSTFRLYFPAAEALLPDDALPAEPAPSQPHTPAAVTGRRETILVVEDEPVLRELSREILEANGYAVIEASNGVEAQQIWKRKRGEIDLLLTDMCMPDGISGRELATRLQADDPALKVIFSSGYSPDCSGTNFILREGFTFLQKPYQPQRLTQTVRNCLDGANPARAAASPVSSPVPA